MEGGIEQIIEKLKGQRESWRNLPVEDVEQIAGMIRPCMEQIARRDQESGNGSQSPVRGDHSLVTVLQLAWIVLRNTCTINPSFQDAIMAQQIGDQWIKQFVTLAAADHVSPCDDHALFRNETNQGQLWNSLFPETLLTLFRLLKSHEDLTSLLVAWIHMLTAQSEDRRKQLVSEEGKLVLRALMSRMESSHDQLFEWIVYVVKGVLQCGLLESLCKLMVDSPDDQFSPVREELIGVWRFIAELIHAERKRPLEQGDCFLPPESCLFVVACVKHAARQELDMAESDPSIQVETMMTLLEILGDLSEAVHALPNYQDLFFQSEIASFCLQLLHLASQANASQQVVNGVRGLKVSLIRILGNLSYRHPPTQHMVREAHGLELIMNQCKIDRTNEFIQEWSVLALRNLCEDNEENQEFVASLRAERVTEIPREMSAAGISCEIQDGKLKYSSPSPK